MRDIYIAGMWEARERLRAERDRIHAAGVGRVISTWLDVVEAAAPSSCERQTYARRDLGELHSAELLILDARDENPRGGREVEFGYALARGVEAWVVGPERNIFHTLAGGFDTWDEAHRQLAKEHEDR